MANNNNNYPDWHGYMQNLTTEQQQQQQPSRDQNMFVMQQQQQQQHVQQQQHQQQQHVQQQQQHVQQQQQQHQHVQQQQQNIQQQQFIQSQQQYRKFSVDFASKRLDINRLTPSYSNPDLSSARRMGSLDAGIRLSRRYDNSNNNTFDDFMDQPSPSPTTTTGSRQNSLFSNNNNNSNLTIYNSQSSTTTTTNTFNMSSAPLLSPSIATTMNPLLVSHLMRQIQPSTSRPPSPTTSRKNSINQLRRTSSATTMNTSSNNNNNNNNNAEQDRFASIKLEDVVEEIYSLCKDQYGCRFFQKKLEEQKPDQRDIIFVQIYPHFVELMTGNKKHIFIYILICTFSNFFASQILLVIICVKN